MAVNDRNDAAPAILERQRDLLDELPFADLQDFEDARRGLVGEASPAVVRNAAGETIWDNDAYGFLDGDCPETVNPSLWRQSQLTATQGLFEVVPGIYQVRGLDLSNMTLIEGEAGVIVIDPLLSTECAAAAMSLYRQHRGDRRVTGVIYTHSHADHFGGVKGVITEQAVRAGRCPILAPAGFLEHAVSENVYAGSAMRRRAVYMYGSGLVKDGRGSVGAGLGQTTSVGTRSLIAPTLDVTHTGQTETVDGVLIEFQLTPGTEAPAEMNFFFPGHASLCLAENATHNMHNLVTLRGAVVRDPHVWARYLTEAVELFGDRMDAAFASHHWPTWGREQITKFLLEQRDLYSYLHDQTVRLINQGHAGAEISELLQLPPALERAWHARGYYGSASHNSKAIYQRYMGWFDGNPAHLWGHTPTGVALRYVEFMGGPDAVLAKARHSYDAGDFRWVAEVVNHVIFADPTNEEAKQLQADALEQLGYGAENATWRNFYLTGATELRRGVVPVQPTQSLDLLGALTVVQLFDSLAVRVDGPRSWNAHIIIDWNLTDKQQSYRLELRNGVLTNREVERGVSGADATFTLDTPMLRRILTGMAQLREETSAGNINIVGDPGKLAELTGYVDTPDPNFAIISP